jgi:hypothetical protein
VQEAILARNASLHCGNAKIPWYNFAHAVAKRVNSSKFNPESLGGKVMVVMTSNLFRKSEDGGILERLLNLKTLVSSLLTFNAENPSDIIYALLSLAQDSTLIKAQQRLEDSKSRDLLRPNYGKLFLEVYPDFVSHCIKLGSLDIIYRH